MSKNWLEKIKHGTKPSELLTSAIGEMGEYSGSQLASRFLEEILSLSDPVNERAELLDIYYPVWHWEKPDKRRKDGISSEQMDAEIIEILKSWGLIGPDTV